ncbi:Gp49 family protein [Stenotrophomonas acidaminiphila]|uniref:Gp49 family protein n=1 Tax=Stenotrophomonas acidaminiphila TaxID=128780 RepID=UPI0028AC54FC|nr:Gp49 family protein [Stenotrophomonas acidaminiphila]
MTGPSKLTLADIEAEIAVEHYFNGRAAAAAGMQVGIANEVTIRSLTCLTICVLTLHNGHKAVGINHGPVDPANFDAEIGRKYAREDAIAKLWNPLGFRLRDQMVRDELSRPSLTEADAAADLAGTPRPDFGLVAGDPQAAAPSYDHAEQARRSEAAASVERPDSIIPIPPGVTGVLLVDSQRPAAALGRIVYYVLSEQDALKINGRRTDGASIQDRILEDKWPCGAQAHIGNKACAGDILPAMVVKVLPNEQVNLQVFLDGNDVYWATTRAQAAPGRMEPGRWHWPARS